MTVRVVLVRPWTDARGGGGCCSGHAPDGICVEGLGGDGSRTRDDEADVVAASYLRLREQLPDVDVQLVAAGNTAYLLPSVFRSVRRRRGSLAALRETNRATTAGSVLVDGERVGDILALGPDGVVAEVRRRCASLTS
ncbi:MAG: hypothetical protein ACTHKG_12080 [Nocardioides sp.]